MQWIQPSRLIRTIYAHLHHLQARSRHCWWPTAATTTQPEALRYHSAGQWLTPGTAKAGPGHYGLAKAVGRRGRWSFGLLASSSPCQQPEPRSSVHGVKPALRWSPGISDLWSTGSSGELRLECNPPPVNCVAFGLLDRTVGLIRPKNWCASGCRPSLEKTCVPKNVIDSIKIFCFRPLRCNYINCVHSGNEASTQEMLKY
jgi:hypothetical protein